VVDRADDPDDVASELLKPVTPLLILDERAGIDERVSNEGL
jgi:hypothetical protein